MGPDDIPTVPNFGIRQRPRVVPTKASSLDGECPYLADAVTREQHLFFEENGYLIITDALNEQEIKDHKFWAQDVPESSALWPVQFLGMIRWLTLSRQEERGGKLLNKPGKHISDRTHFFWGGWVALDHWMSIPVNKPALNRLF